MQPVNGKLLSVSIFLSSITFDHFPIARIPCDADGILFLFQFRPRTQGLGRAVNERRIRYKVDVDNQLNIAFTNDVNFGKLLRQSRRAAGLTQRQLAKAAGVDFSYISKVENGHISPPAADTVVRLCTAMKVSPESLLARTGKLPSDVHQSVSINEAAQAFLRETQQLRLTTDEWHHLKAEVRRLRSRTR